MKKRKFSPIIFCIAAVIIFTAVVYFIFAPDQNDSKIGLFSWNSDVLYGEERVALFATMHENEITELYQYFDEDTDEEAIGEFLYAANDAGIAVYLLAGEPEWGLDESAQEMCLLIEKIQVWREQWGTEMIAGIMLDVEPYLTDAWQDDSRSVMKAYTAAMKIAHEKAEEADVFLIACIPYYYDDEGLQTELETLISEGCDGIAVMNYYRGSEYENIETELGLAEQYGRTVMSIAELQEPGQYDLKEINTYAGLGYDAVLTMWTDLKQKAENESLALGLHNYEALKEM